jgi:hypothetical protein
MNWKGCQLRLSGPDEPLQNLCDGVNENPVRILGVPAEVRTPHFPNTNYKC